MDPSDVYNTSTNNTAVNPYSLFHRKSYSFNLFILLGFFIICVFCFILVNDVAIDKIDQASNYNEKVDSEKRPPF